MATINTLMQIAFVVILLFTKETEWRIPFRESRQFWYVFT